MPQKMGRPPSENPKNHGYRLRMTEEEVEKLAFCVRALGLSKAEVIRQGLALMYEQACLKSQKK